MASFLTELLNSILEMPGTFADVVTHDPISAVLVGLGALVIGVSLGVGAALVGGAMVDAVRPFRHAREHRPRVR